jgi:hypothetical protein
MSQKGKTYECKKCLKEVLVMQEGRHPGPPLCCGGSMREIKSPFFA